MFTQDSLDRLRQSVDLADLISSFSPLKRSGSAYKGLCPFHDEKTPSFMVQKGDTHYHCFGCGAHGDAVQFLLDYAKMNFNDAIQHLSQRYHVPLERAEPKAQEADFNKKLLKEACDYAAKLFHFFLLHTDEGHEALNYLYSRGISLEFIRLFKIGYAPKNDQWFIKLMRAQKFSDESMLKAALLRESQGGVRAFFSERITIPIQDSMGAVIGFSARKYREETFGGKYINTAETPIFKKSRTLFGLSYSRRRIAKEKRALIVEGQLDALSLVFAGLNLTVAGQGTAFGEEHAEELIRLGIERAYLAFDGDSAGMEAAVKVGHIFQKKGIECLVVRFPKNKDPDSILREKGIEQMIALIEQAQQFLVFLIEHQSQGIDMNSPAAKNRFAAELVKMIREWGGAVMVHESLKQLATLLKIPETSIGVGQEQVPLLHIQSRGNIGSAHFDLDRILERDFLHWLFLAHQVDLQYVELAIANIPLSYLRDPMCIELYKIFLSLHEKKEKIGALNWTAGTTSAEAQRLIAEMVQRPLAADRLSQAIHEIIQKLLERQWIFQREEIRLQLQSGQLSDEAALKLLLKFSELQKQRPQISYPQEINQSS